MLGLARAIAEVGHGVFQMTSNHTQMESELWWLREVARTSGQPVCFALVQTDQTPDMWKDLLAAVDQAQSEGLPLYGSVSARPAGTLMSFQGTIHPFRMHPAWRELAGLSWPQRLAALRDPVWRDRLTDMEVLTEAGLLPGALLRNAGQRFVCREVALSLTNHRKWRVYERFLRKQGLGQRSSAIVFSSSLRIA